MLCVGLRYYIGIPQDRFPEVTERKEVMKDMTDEEKRSILELIFKNELKEVGDKNTDLDDTETNKRKDEFINYANKESLSPTNSVGDGSKNEVYNNKIESETSVNTISTGTLTAVDDFGKDVHEENDVCSICLESFVSDGKVLEASDVLCAPNCSHSFHKECIMEWFLSQSSNLTCPDCRSQMFTVDELRAASKAFLDDANKDEKDVASFRKKFICWWKV
ncbi:hypothetical protein CTEN210_01018 [Chaetoceros tenuissimus]|uniref:RING-type domain-containing protein n=1 Tax=Chaetoceros tenuissimus TaxID=426638 RepID=A0AAD3CF85_9STRA|nr:hypothetical protein CTEN210_01018 [Chaetoceros tenuissimus]